MSIILGITLLAVATAAFARTAWVCDDAYITLRTVDNFVNGHGLRWNVAERVQVFTHPLWLLLEIIPYWITREAYHTALFLSILVSLAALGVLIFRPRVPPHCVAGGVLILLLSRAFVDYSTSGLENPLTHLLLVAFLVLLTEGPPDRRRLFILAGIVGLAALNRLDSSLLFMPALLLMLIRFGWRRGLSTVALGLAPVLLWMVFATFYYGCPVPNSALAKLSTGIGSLDLIRQGSYYFSDSLRQDPLTLLVILAGLVLVAIRHKPREIAVGLGIVSYLAYILRIGGDFMSGRFFTAPFLASVVLLVQAGIYSCRRTKIAALGLAVLVGSLAARSSISGGPEFGLDQSRQTGEHGITDERAYYFWVSGMTSGSADPERPGGEAVRAGLRLRRTDSPIAVVGSIGLIGYYAGPAVHVLDMAALSDPLLARLPIAERDPYFDSYLEKTFGRRDPRGWRIGHFLRVIPDGYVRTLLSRENAIQNPETAELYDHLALITRGPLWSARRIKDILQLNLGRFDHLIDHKVHPAYNLEYWDEVIEVRPDVSEAYFMRASARLVSRDVNGAVADLNRSLSLDPEYGAALAMLGMVYATELRDTTRAVSAWMKAIRSDPMDTSTRIRLGDLAIQSKRYAEAAAHYEEAYRADPRLGYLCSRIAQAYAALGQQQPAIGWLKKALRANPDDAEACYLIGLLMERTGSREEGLGYIRRAARLGFGPAQSALRARESGR